MLKFRTPSPAVARLVNSASNNDCESKRTRSIWCGGVVWCGGCMVVYGVVVKHGVVVGCSVVS